MATYYWLEEGANQLILDTTALKLDLGMTSRKFAITQYAGRDGGSVRGFGGLKPKPIKFSIRSTQDSTSVTAFNNARLAIQAWLMKSATKDVYFHLVNSSDSVEYRTLISPNSAGSDVYSKHYGATDIRSFQIISLWGYYEKEVATTTNYSYTTADAEESFAVTVAGIVDTFPIVKFTPTANATYIDVKLSQTYGFRLERNNFPAGSQVIYSCKDNSLTIGGVTYQTRQFLTAGSGFFVSNGSNTLYITSDSAGAVSIDHNERVT